MTALPGAFGGCRCGHALILHEGHALAPNCSATRCECLEPKPAMPTGLRPPAAPTPATPVVAAPAAPRRSLIDVGMASTNPRIASMATRVADQMAALAAAIREDEGKAAARAEVAELKQRLADAKARLKGARPSTPAAAPIAPPAPTSEYACSRADCGRTFISGQARAMHERRAHDGFDPRAAS